MIAAKRERQRLRLSLKPTTPAQVVLSRLNRLPAKLREPVLLCELFQVPISAAAQTLRLKERRLGKRVAAGLKKLQRHARKTKDNAQAILRSLWIAPPAEMSERIVAPVEPAHAREPLVRLTIWSWRWIRLRPALRRTLATIGGIICVLALLFASFAYLATHGYLTAFFIRMGQRQAFKEFPEMLKPARPWPVTAADLAVARTTPPLTYEDLFQMTNIWPVKFTLTPDQLKGLEPARIPPVRDMFGHGRIVLRNPKAKRSGLAGVLGFEFNWVEARMDFAGKSYDKVAVRYRGNGTYLNSLYGRKQSLKLDVNKYDKTNELAGVHELNFLNTVVDYSYLHDALAEKLFRDLGALGPRTAYAYVTIEIPRNAEVQPRGLFVMMENVDSDFAAHRFGTKKAPIFKPVTYELFEDLGDDWKAYEAIYDLKTKATPEEKQRLIDFAKLVSHASDEEFARRLAEVLDFPEFAAFLAGHVLLSSYDGFLVNGQNYYVYLDPRSNKFGFVPWDQDHSWGDFGHIANTEQRENASIWKPATYDFRFLNRVMKVEAFRAIYQEKLEKALASSFTKEKLFAQIDALAAQIRPAVAAESEFRLKRFDQAVSSEWLPGPRDGEAEGPKAPVHQIKRFITNRIKSVRDQLDGKSEGMRLAGFR